MKYVAIFALLVLSACGGGAMVGEATNFGPNTRVGNDSWTGQEPYSPSEYAL